MYKAKILGTTNKGYLIEVPSLGLSSLEAYLVADKGFSGVYHKDDLVIASRLNDDSWVILGYIVLNKNRVTI